jgi:sulfotransferase
MSRNLIYVTGLARSGSTLLCQLLAQHPAIYSTAHSSPLCHAVNNLRRQLSDDPFLLAQLDNDFDLVYRRLTNAFRGFVDGWFAETDKQWVVDKNRGWLGSIETVHHLDPDFRMLVCVRELVQLYGSIESRHQETILLDFPDHLANRSRYARADSLFSPNGVIGGPLRSLQSVQDLDEGIQKRMFYVVFEDLVREPRRVLRDMFAWLGLPQADIDTDNLVLQPTESDSHYRFKYPHRVGNSVAPPPEHRVSARIARQIRRNYRNYRWYYEMFYPGLVEPSA